MLTVRPHDAGQNLLDPVQLNAYISLSRAGFLTSGNPGAVAAGVIFGVILPAIYFGAVVWLVVWHILLSRGTYPPPVYVLYSEEKEAEGHEAERLKSDDVTAVDPSSSKIDDGSHSPNESVDHEKKGAASHGLGHMGHKMFHWFEKYFLVPVVGFKPEEEGHWVPAVPGDPFLAKYGLYIQTAKGPHHRYVHGSFQHRDDGALDRGRFIALGKSRRDKAKHVLQVLGLVVIGLKCVLFTNIMAGMSNGVAPLVPVILLLCLLVFYVAYVRIVSPFAELKDALAEALGILCDTGTFICGIIAISIPVTSTSSIVKLGWAMLAFQVGGMAANIIPPLTDILVLLGEFLTLALASNTPKPEDRFAQVVFDVMARDHGILARKFADRWLVKVHGRGLGERQLTPADLEKLKRAPSVKEVVVAPLKAIQWAGSGIRRTASMARRGSGASDGQLPMAEVPGARKSQIS